MNSDILSKLDAEHVTRLKLSENPEFPITQTYIYELIKIIDYNKELAKTITSDEHSELLAYITSLYSRLISPNTNTTSGILDKSDCTCSDDKLYNFCIHSVNAFIKCKHFDRIITTLPLFNLFLIISTDFYKDNLVFTAYSLEDYKSHKLETTLISNAEKQIINSILLNYNNYKLKQKITLLFIMIEFVMRFHYFKVNEKFANVICDKINHIKTIIKTDCDLRLQMHDILTRCNCTLNILDDWISIIEDHYKTEA